MDKLNIRAATIDDAEPVARLIYEAIHDIAYQLTGEATAEDALKALAELFREEGNRFSSKQILAAEVDGKVAGIILCYHGSEADRLDAPIAARLRKRTGNPNPPIDKEADEDEYYIDSIAVFPEYRGRGIAKALLASAEHAGAALGYGRIALNVEYGNDGAERLYRSIGYESDKTITINNTPFHHMFKPLTAQ
ncbi:GNAT family N-acetyltransferase [Paenibacillus sp. PR3]|uniref:GNAT family N-acetyltransferase n=1 Tax=Paenibacillus terricola TaxID=2763503 RepID=A0ABR8MXC7_9BACL|nr:GNAT family N-acetyltransferase [Paenibacillus terricola]MBD3920619.1 GNAT family N-acetyltransferase [Paenibacillus terricola]